ncbi:3'(2'),5'-bisphosphate nucleotidase CysQ [Flagellimonas myxillae]|uniref:3'(2'),5'-bisphosphate nucleotidase CysQ n=1 Tax=Flagellimonas myxillae TaxID=2942214 RepID=UPI00201F9ACE|nr:3'(2'),5'-bisphosphate nucleotidase CysQ [Muricauda myxillae]MCL6266658.1 3'(2'),5'-bisphosphate nucleotidase CysQ [Muricauda myxillae]
MELKTNLKISSLLKTAIDASIEAGKAILEVYENTDFQVHEKGDKSPLTAADLNSNKVINEYLVPTQIPIISEENKQLDFEVRKQWETCWMVDPLDGTKEFIKRNGEFTVNIALIHDGAPVLGVIYVPVTRELYFAEIKDQKAFKLVLNENHELPDTPLTASNQIHPGSESQSKIRIVGSRSHMNSDTEHFISNIKEQYEEVEIVSKGSSLKFCLVAEGKADIYPRFAPTMEWDTAAGHAICKAVGLQVISNDTNEELPYNKENLLNSHFLIRN